MPTLDADPCSVRPRLIGCRSPVGNQVPECLGETPACRVSSPTMNASACARLLFSWTGPTNLRVVATVFYRLRTPLIRSCQAFLRPWWDSHWHWSPSEVRTPFPRSQHGTNGSRDTLKSSATAIFPHDLSSLSDGSANTASGLQSPRHPLTYPRPLAEDSSSISCTETTIE
jgi:hypothetical protein